jgi:mannobiose 2-epimerase
MSVEQALEALRAGMREELTQRILPFWIERAHDRRRGGTIGFISEDGQPDLAAPKGAILHARVLWTHSAAFRALGDVAYRVAADQSVVHFVAHFVDPTYGGVFWMVDAEGRPRDDRKHVYAQAFAIYALAEHHRATGDAHSLRSAIAIHRLVEAHAHDAVHGGYEEAFARDWTLLDDVRLSDVDLNERKSMNTHLHLLEAYTTLYTAWPDARLAERLRELVELVLDRMIAPDGDRVIGFFAADWQPRSTRISFGHDIETSWLLVEAAEAVGDDALRMRAHDAALLLAASVLRRGVDQEFGGLFNESDGDTLDTDKEWWPQAEAIVGFLAAYQQSGDEALLRPALDTWRFVERHVVDRRNGEWRRRVSRSGNESRGGEKVGPWKCPYHNARACLEIMSRVDALLAPAVERTAV